MSLVLDAVLVAALARELEARLRGARLRALRMDRARRSLALLFREGTLQLGLNAEAGTIAWHEPVAVEPGDRPLAARLRGVRALPDDRVLVLELARARGAPPGVDLIVEWISNRWNAVLAEGPERIVRHVLVERAGARAPRVGRPWPAPEPSPRAGMDGWLPLERWRALLVPVEPGRRQRALLAAVAWTSPLNAEALLGAAAGAATEGEPDARDAEHAFDAGHRFWEELAAVALGSAEPDPVLLWTGGGLQPYPLPLPGTPAEPQPTLLAAFTHAAAAVGELPAALPPALLDALAERAVRAWARADALRRELAENPDPATLRGAGDLLLARLAELERGVGRARLTGFDGRPVELDLDPTRSPQENASAYYKRAGRAERACARLPELIVEAEREARRLEGLVERARAGEVGTEALRAELPSLEEGARGPAAPTLPYRVYRSSGGLEIRVGRGARHNDDLTFHHSAPDDVWLHARHASGAHVVLRWRGDGNPPTRDLTEAAVLAALHSKARTSGSVPVDWTRRKYVRKPRRSPPGQVLVERTKTLFVAPDPRLEEQLRV